MKATLLALAAFVAASLPSLALEELFTDPLEDATGIPVPIDRLEAKVVLVYFSAEWCGPCRTFTPSLVEFREQHQDSLEVVFVSADASPEDQRTYMTNAGMTFPAVPHGSATTDRLLSLFEVEGIPHLGVLGPDGEILALDGRADVAEAPELALERWLSGESKPQPPPFADEVWELLSGFEGQLAKGDRRLETGEFVATHRFEAEAGSRLRFDLRSEDFDAFLAVTSPDGSIWRNDDHGEGSDSRVEPAVLAEGGVYTLHVTTFGQDESGTYRLEVSRRARAVGEIANFRGALGPEAPGSERRLKQDGFIAAHTFAGRRGQRICIDMTARGFHPELILASPAGELAFEIETSEESSHARIETVLQEDGEYTLFAASFDPEDRGDYVVTVYDFGMAGD